MSCSDRPLETLETGLEAVLFISDRESEFLRLWRVDLLTKALKPLTGEIGWDVEDAVMSSDGSVAAYAVNEGGIDRLRLLDMSTEKHLPAPDLPKGTSGRGRGAPGGTVSWPFHLRLHEARATPIPITSKHANSHVGPAAKSAASTPIHFPNRRLITYPTIDTVDGKQRTIPAFLVKPPARFEAPYPVSITTAPRARPKPGFRALHPPTR